MATDINKLIEPSSSNMPYFTLTAHKTPEELVEATTRLLTVIKTQPKLLNAFRMEVEISDENVLLRVCLDTKSWYDVYLRTKPRDEAVMIARQYITDTRNKVSSEKDGPSIINLNLELEKEKAYTPCNKAAFHSINLCGKCAPYIIAIFATTLIDLLTFCRIRPQRVRMQSEGANPRFSRGML